MQKFVRFGRETIADDMHFYSGDEVPEVDLHPDTVASLTYSGFATRFEVPDEVDLPDEPEEEVARPRVRRRKRAEASDGMVADQERLDTVPDEEPGEQQ